MIACPNCKHDNPEGATNCEACYTTLPATKACPNCGASIQLDATFCGQCGHNLKSTGDVKSPIGSSSPEPVAATTAPSGLPPTVLTNPMANIVAPANEPVAPVVATSPAIVPIVVEPQPISQPEIQPIVQLEANPPVIIEPVVSVEPTPVTPAITTPPVSTQLQQPARQLMHLQSNTAVEIPAHLQVIHLGKPNDLTPPDIDVSVFASAEVVSRIHANIRIDGANYYIEDLGSANGTYINHNTLAKGNRHLLRDGDRISLGKGDLVTFIFQASI
jgi:FHA domain/Double zinc ribbon